MFSQVKIPQSTLISISGQENLNTSVRKWHCGHAVGKVQFYVYSCSKEDVERYRETGTLPDHLNDSNEPPRKHKKIRPNPGIGVIDINLFS